MLACLEPSAQMTGRIFTFASEPCLVTILNNTTIHLRLSIGTLAFSHSGN